VITIRSPEGEILVIDENDLQSNGEENWQNPYPGWEVVSDTEPTHDNQSFINGAWVDDLPAAKAEAINRINLAEQEANERMTRVITAFSMIELWSDIKRLERDQADNKIPTTVTERNERYPFVSAVAAVANVTLAAAATTAKAELAPKVTQIALYAARALLARRNVNNATTLEQVQAAANTDLES